VRFRFSFVCFCFFPTIFTAGKIRVDVFGIYFYFLTIFEHTNLILNCYFFPEKQEKLEFFLIYFIFKILF
jgi:hypothetical protein